MIIALASYVHCEEAEGRTDNYSYAKNNTTKEQLSNDGAYSVTESIIEYSSPFQGHDTNLQTNEETSNRQGRIMTKSKRQHHENSKNSITSYQYSNNRANDYNKYGNVIYKPYPVFIKTFDTVPPKQNIGTKFNNFASFPQRRYHISSPKESKPFIPSPQIFEAEYGSTEFQNTKYQSRGYESNQYKYPVQYMSKPITWAGGSNGYTHGFDVSGNGIEKVEQYSPTVNGYASSFNNNGFEAIKAYNPVVPGFRISSGNMHSARKFGAPRALAFNDHKIQRVKSYESPQGTTFQYNSVPAPVKEHYYEPAVESGNEIGNAEKQIKTPEFETQGHQQYMYVLPKEYASISSTNGNVYESTESDNKVPEVNTYGRQQYMYVTPKAFASNPGATYGSQNPSAHFGNSFQYVPNFTNEYNKDYLSAPSFQSSLRDIVKMVDEEQRKSNGKAIFLIGKPQIPQHLLSNTAGYASPSSQQGFSSNVNTFNGYKY